MRRILLINPNSSAATTAMMVGIAQAAAAGACEIAGATARRAPPMIVEPDALAAATDEVVELAVSNDGKYDGFIVAAFGDPGLAEVRERCRTPAVGIAESAFREASAGGRRFGIATTTPALKAVIDRRVALLGLSAQYTGLRITSADPTELVKDKARLRDALADVVRHCINDDGAEAVIIGGGPLGEAARELKSMFSVPIIAPISAAIRSILAILAPK
ncbi:MULTISPECIES: aspartate/glutamate racemase family protein [unclassified Bradyrhizobium]|uniref:aspartate/glutamate racemase family protein n=1 Tax=unclassified Bradyrhizobium TaxID=2631580 RepID=UPI001BA68CE3|nr:MULTISPECIES: aspartate/glutamate racemase family protein [unclassified Bradyrhizobium]MBR1229274.1 aspartate/glutamate racemase family protein [Bradyrhizobium sp. AUGA SZCCT0176]MBR1300928.1 aspartate/glutamate racemase family protein [Bradyrhizobium sp. AUGA SZCCT0042]